MVVANTWILEEHKNWKTQEWKGLELHVIRNNESDILVHMNYPSMPTEEGRPPLNPGMTKLKYFLPIFHCLSESPSQPS